MEFKVGDIVQRYAGTKAKVIAILPKHGSTDQWITLLRKYKSDGSLYIKSMKMCGEWKIIERPETKEEQ